MMNENFRELRKLCQKIDKDIVYLEKIWDSPQLLIGGYGDNVEEAGPYFERFICDIKDLQDQLIADQEPRAKFISDTQDGIDTAKNFYEHMKQDLEGLEAMLCDWGFKPPLDNSECLPTDESEAESSILTPEQMTDNLSPCANYNERNANDVFFTPTVKSDHPKSIATPMINSRVSEIKSAQRSRANIPSSLDRPLKDYLSPYNGRRMK